MRSKINAAVVSTLMRWTLLLTVQALMFALAGTAAFLLRFDFRLPELAVLQLACALPIWVVVKSIAFQCAKLNRRGLRYVTIDDLYRLLIANGAGSALSSLFIIKVGPPNVPGSIFVSDFILSLLTTVGLRVIVRMVIEFGRRNAPSGTEKSIFIYGAGVAGNSLLREIRNNPELAYRVCGFLDDDTRKKGMAIAGIGVLGGGEEIPRLIEKHRVESILIAIPSATGPEMTRILTFCHDAKVECKTVPGLGEIIKGDGLIGQIRDVAVEDLLGRTPVHLEEDRIRGTIEGRIVLVTGAAGSIGSELCRQIARFNPAGIVGFEIAESPLFEIDQEMRRTFPAVPFFAEIGSIQNSQRIEEVVRKYSPSTIYHAAAYKHVPLMEHHVFEAVENNILGTYNVAVTAARHSVENFVLVSSDKAVRPTNMMGVTKRLAELLLQSLQNGGTQYVTVRFGNVLGSSGSVIPIFKKQIAMGGPITVTDPEMCRFFMTIPEACQLVLQAAAIATGGQICVLEMGEPVKIVDLARNLIRLSGFTPGKDMQITYTGKRPGEKLCEELTMFFEESVRSSHEKVRIYAGNALYPDNIEQWISSLREICRSRDLNRLLHELKDIVVDYDPSLDLLERSNAPTECYGLLMDRSGEDRLHQRV